MALSLHARPAARFALSLLCLLSFSAPALSNESSQEPVALDVPYVPTPDTVVYRMLELADLQPDDYLIDLGSGDGRIVIAAARDWNVKKGYGIDIDPQRVDEARMNARYAKVDERVSFERDNIFEMDFSDADVLTMYLLPQINLDLRPLILERLRPGTRVVSHSFDMGEWRADESIEVHKRYVYKWIVPARLAGSWQLTKADGSTLSLELEQKFQFVEGQAKSGDKVFPLAFSALRGKDFRFSVNGEHFSAQVEGDEMRAVPGNQRIEGWHAKRI